MQGVLAGHARRVAGAAVGARFGCFDCTRVGAGEGGIAAASCGSRC
jgi:hypothetical protein